MKLWLLSVGDDEVIAWSWDMNYGFVIRAETEGEARTMAETQRSAEQKGVWLSSEYTVCEELVADGLPGVILADFHAG